MKRYENYKPTGTKWLADIPASWTCKKIGELFSQRKVKVSDKDYPPISVTKNGILPQLKTAAKTDDGDNRKLVLVGDFVINSRSDRKGSCGVSALDGSVSLINIVLQPRNELSGQYAHYLLRSQPFSEEYYRNGRGIVADLWTTRYSEMKSILLPVPPRTEQDQIVRYLDWQVSKINRLIAAKKKQIECLREQFSTVINDTISGRNVSTSKVYSGYSMFGNIPQGWHIRPFSKIAKVKSNLVNPTNYLDMPQISPASIEKNTGRIIKECTVEGSGVSSPNHHFFKGQIVYSKIRPLLNKAVIAPYDGLCSADMYPIETILDTEYLLYYLLSESFLQQLSISGNRVKMPKINQEELGATLVLFPDMKVQKEIVNYIKNKCGIIQRTIDVFLTQIASIIELRTRLISDAVTGHIDVRDVEIPDFEYTPETDDDGEDTAEEENDDMIEEEV